MRRAGLGRPKLAHREHAHCLTDGQIRSALLAYSVPSPLPELARLLHSTIYFAAPHSAAARGTASPKTAHARRRAEGVADAYSFGVDLLAIRYARPADLQ